MKQTRRRIFWLAGRLLNFFQLILRGFFVPFIALLFVLAFLLLALEVKFGTYGISALTGAGVLAGALLMLVDSTKLLEDSIHPLAHAIIVALSLALGIIACFQGMLALRMRRERRLAGMDELVGRTGVCRTAVHANGTVFVRGEYWQASSEAAIPMGTAVVVVGSHDLTLYVKEA